MRHKEILKDDIWKCVKNSKQMPNILAILLYSGVGKEKLLIKLPCHEMVIFTAIKISIKCWYRILNSNFLLLLSLWFFNEVPAASEELIFS